MKINLIRLLVILVPSLIAISIALSVSASLYAASVTGICIGLMIYVGILHYAFKTNFRRSQFLMERLKAITEVA